MPTSEPQTAPAPQLFAGRRIYVTGAASGIGRALAELLAERGARLALVDVDSAGLVQTAATTGGVPLVVDLRDGNAIDRSVAEAAAALGGLDGVVNCAAVAPNATLDKLDPQLWADVLAINLTAAYYVCRAALPWLAKGQAASIVNLSSGVAMLPTGPGVSAYAAAKGGLISFSKALAKELAPAIRVNVVCPGVTQTPMTVDVLGEDPDASDFVRQYTMQRVAQPIEIARAIAFLLSDEASYVTGSTFAIDGGRTFH